MANKSLSGTRISFLVVLLILAYFAYVTVLPLLSYLLFSGVLVMITHPLYIWLKKKTNRPRFAAFCLVIALILLLVVPAIWFAFVMVEQAPAAYGSFVSSIDAGRLDMVVEESLGLDSSVSEWATQSVSRFRDYIVSSVPQFLSNATQIILGLFIMFFVMFFMFLQGDDVLESLKRITPLSQKHTKGLLNSINQTVHGVMVGQIFTGLLQGSLVVLAFLVLSVPNALFWGFVTAIFSMIPFAGSAIVWLPAGLLLLVEGQVWQGIAMLTFGGLFISQIDNVIRPLIVGQYAEIHPALVLVGVIGGLSAFGVIGFIVGPLVLALFKAFLQFYSEESL